MNLTERSLTFEIFDFMELVDLPLKDYEDDHNDWFENEFGEEERYAIYEMVNNQDPTQYELIPTPLPPAPPPSWFPPPPG